MAEDQGREAPKESNRLAVTDLAYPALVVQRGGFIICSDERSLMGFTGLLVDRHGWCYRMVGTDDPEDLWPRNQLPPRAERRRLIAERRAMITRGEALPPGAVLYTGKPVQLSVNQVLEKIVWIVSASGHFEFPMGLPTLSHAQSVQELLDVLLANGWRHHGSILRGDGEVWLPLRCPTCGLRHPWSTPRCACGNDLQAIVSSYSRRNIGLGFGFLAIAFLGRLAGNKLAYDVITLLCGMGLLVRGARQRRILRKMVSSPGLSK